MPDAFTKVSLAAVDDAAPGNGFGDRWEARVARDALAAERTGVTLFRLLPGKRSPFTHRHTDAEETEQADLIAQARQAIDLCRPSRTR